MWLDLGVSFGQIFKQNVEDFLISGIFHDQKVIGAGFNLLVQRTEEEEEESLDAVEHLDLDLEVEPLEWHNCAADKANVAEDQVCGDRS